MLATEISYLDTDFRRSVVTSDPARFAKRFADNTYHYLFEVTRFVDFIRWVSPPPVMNEQGLRPTLHKIYHPMAEFVIAMMQVTQVFSVRLAILTLAMPIFLLFSLVALVDGLVQRDLRRWGGGRESSFVYHYAKKAALPLVVIDMGDVSRPAVQPASDVCRVAFRRAVRADGGGYGEHVQEIPIARSTARHH